MGSVVADLSAVLRLRTEKLKGNRNLTAAIVDSPPELVLSMDGAATLSLTVQDAERAVLTDPAIKRKSWVEVDGPGKSVIRMELVRIRKSGNRLGFEFEDGIVAALRREQSPLSIPAGSTSRAEAIQRLAKPAQVKVVIDDSDKTTVKRPIQRSADGGEKTNSWDVIGELAEERAWRRFSDGVKLLVGPDEWLMERDAKPTVLREYTGAVHEIDFDLDVGRRASEATVSVDAEMWGLRPGEVARVHDEMGPASGLWLVREFRRPLTSTRATVYLIRKRHELEEPKRERSVGDGGDPNFLPTDLGATTGTAANASREAMVRYALAQAGDPYVWGGHGPDVWDCSGLVQAATAAGGSTLGAPSASQWGACVAAGRTIPVSVGIQTRGALLFRIGGEYNHVAISLGNGSTIEAKGSAYGTGVFGGAAAGGWTGAALWL